MELIDTLDRLAAKLDQQAAHIQTEEATKNALIMPVINALGYNVFDPTEVTPEFTADVGTKKGEKVDYAINIGGDPMILMECKALGSQLGLKHASQLYRYFSVSRARFGVLTNGTEFWFYSDLEAPNKMDEKPFFIFDMRDYDQESVSQLSKFSKATFDLENILSNASELKYAQQIERELDCEFNSPSEEFVRLLTSRVYAGRFTAAVNEQFSALVSNAFRNFVSEKVSSRLKRALRGEIGSLGPSGGTTPEEDQAHEPDPDDGIVTTAEEVEGFHVVRAILAKVVDPRRVVMRDTKSYCGVLLDDNNRKPICRLRFNSSNKQVGLFDSDKNETRHSIDSVHNIYAHAEALIEVVHGHDA
jgi:hypothetical protein